MKKEKISIVIGLYNSEKTIRDVISEIRDEMTKISSDYDYEVVLVNDCGPDNVLEIVKEIAQHDKHIKIVELAKNSGQTNAVMEGYTYATGDYIVEMDDDFQMPAYEIPRMLKELKDRDLDVVFAKYKEHKESWFRLLGSKINSKMTEIMIDKPKDITINSFFIMRKMVKEAMIKYKNNYPYLYGIIFATTSHVGNLEVDHRPRTNGKSNYTFKKLLGLWMNGLLNFSVKPLRIATFFGLIIALLSLVLIVVLVILQLVNGTKMTGWTSLIGATIFFSGVILIGIGIIGEYIGRLFLSASGLSRTSVRNTVNCEGDGDEKNTTED